MPLAGLMLLTGFAEWDLTNIQTTFLLNPGPAHSYNEIINKCVCS